MIRDIEKYDGTESNAEDSISPREYVKPVDLCTVCSNWCCGDCRLYDRVIPTYNRKETKVVSCYDFNVRGAGIISFILRCLIVLGAVGILAALTVEGIWWDSILVAAVLACITSGLWQMWRNVERQLSRQRKLKERMEREGDVWKDN